MHSFSPSSYSTISTFKSSPFSVGVCLDYSRRPFHDWILIGRDRTPVHGGEGIWWGLDLWNRMLITLHRRDGCPHLSTLLFFGVVVFHPNAAVTFALFAVAVAFADNFVFVAIGLGRYSWWECVWQEWHRWRKRIQKLCLHERDVSPLTSW